jgi:hypothetical protein
MTERLKQIKIEEISKLPEEVRKIINISNWEKLSEDIGIKYALSENQIDKLQTEILLVLINAEYLNDLEINIQGQLGLEEEDAKNIKKELENQIFNPISLKINDEINKNMPFKKPNWKQTVNFIVSGGDYSAFIG